MDKYERVESVAYRLRKAMTISGKTQADLVRETGIGKSNLSRYMTGKYEPKSDAVYKLATALNVAEMWLWGCDVPMERPAPEDLGTIAADVVLNPDLLHLAQIYLELEEADKNMLLMLAENMHQKTKKD